MREINDTSPPPPPPLLLLLVASGRRRSRQYTRIPTDHPEQAPLKGQEGNQEKGRRPFHQEGVVRHQGPWLL